MNQSADINELAEALAKAQGQLDKVIASETAKVQTKTGGQYSYTYATLAGVLAACRKPLSENNIALIQPTEGGIDGVTVHTKLIHKSGQWIETSITLRPTQQDIQGMGSAITYGRRYTLMALVGLAPEDDDGQAAIKQPHQFTGQRRVENQMEQPADQQPTPINRPKVDPSQPILRLMVKNGLKLEDVLRICGLPGPDLKGLDEAMAAVALEKLNIYLKEVKEA